MIIHRFRLKIHILLLMVFLIPGAGPASEKKTYTIGVIPTWPPVVTYAQWSPFVERLSHDTGLKLRLRVYEKMSDFEREIITSKGPDFIFANALQAVIAHREQGYIPLVRGKNGVEGILFVKRDSNIRNVEDLSGKRIAFVGSKNL